MSECEREREREGVRERERERERVIERDHKCGCLLVKFFLSFVSTNGFQAIFRLRFRLNKTFFSSSLTYNKLECFSLVCFLLVLPLANQTMRAQCFKTFSLSLIPNTNKLKCSFLPIFLN